MRFVFEDSSSVSYEFLKEPFIDPPIGQPSSMDHYWIWNSQSTPKEDIQKFSKLKVKTIELFDLSYKNNPNEDKSEHFYSFELSDNDREKALEAIQCFITYVH